LLRRLGILGGWFGAAFAVRTAFAMASFGSGWPLWAALVVYGLGFAAMFPLHGKTRGPLPIAVAFALCFALLVEGLAFVLGDPGARRAVLVLFALPLAAFVLRRWSVDDEDAWFSQNLRRVAPFALAFAFPPFAVGVLGARQADPTPYERAERALGYNPFEALVFEGVGFDRRAHAESRWAAFRSATTVTPEIRSDVERVCGHFAANDPGRAVHCAYERLTSKSEQVRKRRDIFRFSALASAVPWAILVLFAWRGRRRAPGVHAGPTE